MSETDAFDLLMEARWEQEGTRRAAQRYREAAASADPATLPSGQKLLREVVPPLTAKIVELQRRAADMVGAPVGSKVRWAIPIMLLDASTLAVITVVRALSGAEVPTDQAASVTGLAGDIAQAVRDELDYRSWMAAQIAANKVAKTDQDWEHVDLLRQFKLRYPQADRRSWRNFSKRLALSQTEWDKETSIQLGAALIHALVEAAPERFEIDTRSMEKGRTQNYLRLSTETTAMLRDIETRAEVARPMLMPMLIPPIKWTVTG